MLFRKIAFVAVPLLFSSVAWADLGAKCCPFSDENLKENIKPLDHSLEKILKLKGVSYTWKEDKTGDVGLIAQRSPASLSASCSCHSSSQTLKTKEIPHRADHHPCVLFPVAFTTTNLNSNT